MSRIVILGFDSRQHADAAHRAVEQTLPEWGGELLRPAPEDTRG